MKVVGGASKESKDGQIYRAIDDEKEVVVKEYIDYAKAKEAIKKEIVSRAFGEYDISVKI